MSWKLIEFCFALLLLLLLSGFSTQKNTLDIPKFPYVKDIDFSPDYHTANKVFLDQIYQNQVYCDLNLILSQSYIDRFKNFHDAVRFVEMALQMVNGIFERQFSWEKNRPMVVYMIKSVHQLTRNNSLTNNIDEPEKLLKILNEIYAMNGQQYCQNLLLTAENWGDILGVAFQDLVTKPQGSLCETPSSFVLTSLMKSRFINHATLAYLIAHEIAHTLCADHDVLNNGGKEGDNKKTHVIFDSDYFKKSHLLRPNHNNHPIMRHFIMDAGTGMVPEYVLPEFSDSSTNVIAQCLFIKGRECFKKPSFNICGNGIVEVGEDCDSNDHCCHSPGSSLECTFMSGAVCSTDKPCCNAACQFKQSNAICHTATECSVDSYCSGESSICHIGHLPTQHHSECNGGRALCNKGKCDTSLCIKYHQESCTSLGDDACLIKCYNATTQRCESIRNSHRSKKSLLIPNGWKCGAAQRGICDDGVCRVKATHSFFYTETPYKYVSITFISLTIVAIIATLYIGYVVNKFSSHYSSSTSQSPLVVLQN